MGLDADLQNAAARFERLFSDREGQYVGKALADALRAQEPLARPGWIGIGTGEEPKPTG